MGGGMGALDPEAMGAEEGQLPQHLLDALQHGMNEEMLADMLGNIPADQAAELQRLVQQGTPRIMPSRCSALQGKVHYSTVHVKICK